MKEKPVFEIEMPAGKYFLGDPCYAVGTGGVDWIEWIEAADYRNKEHLVAPYGDCGSAIGLSAKYGDGEYPDQHGNTYPVDAGLIGLVPVTTDNAHVAKSATGDELNRIVEFPEDFVCKAFKDGRLVFGDIVINTGVDCWGEV